jgi:hypothetical protein
MKGGWTENELKQNAKWSKVKVKNRRTMRLVWKAEVRLEGDENR